MLPPHSRVRASSVRSPGDSGLQGGAGPAAPGHAAPPLEVWGGIECSVVRIGDAWRDQVRETGHHDRPGDLDQVALVRVEQLYPFPARALRAQFDAYPGAERVLWVQEEPANQGAWAHMALSLPDHLPEGRELRRLSRRAGSSPAAGSSKVHEAEQAALVAAALEA